MPDNNEHEERYLLKGGVVFNDETPQKEKRINYEDLGLKSIWSELENNTPLNINNEFLIPLKQENVIKEYRIANNDNEINKLKTENEILNKQIKENRKLINSIKKQESNISKINVARKDKYIVFPNISKEEPIIQKQRMLVNQEYENALKMKEIADSLYGSDEEYFKKFYENNKKPVWYIPENTITKPKINAISDSEKMFFPQGTLADMPPAKLNDTKKEKDYNEIAEMFYPNMEVKKKDKKGILTGGAVNSSDSNNNKKGVDTNKVLEILGLNSKEYKLEGNTISTIPNNNEKSTTNSLSPEESKKQRYEYLNSNKSKVFQQGVDNINYTGFDKFTDLKLTRETIENLRMAKAESYMNTTYARRHKIYNNYKEVPVELREYFKGKITEQVGLDKLEKTKGIYINKNSDSSKSLSSALHRNKNFLKYLSKYLPTMKLKYFINESIELKSFNWHYAIGKCDIRNMHINKNGDIELYITDVYNFEDYAEGLNAIGFDRQKKDEIIPYFIIYHVVIPKAEIEKKLAGK